MSRDRLTQLALELMKIGVSTSGVERLLALHDPDEIERQLKFLPYRKAKRPEAFIIEAVRRRYSAPKDFFLHAKNSPHPARAADAVDESPERPAGSPDAAS